MMKTKMTADTQKDQQATSAFQYNPIFQKMTKLTWNSPSGGWHFYGPNPDSGTSYGMWSSKKDKLGVIAPISDEGIEVYSPLSGEPLQYEGPASEDARQSVLNYKGEFQFFPPTKSGKTCLTTAPIFDPKINTETMFNPFTGEDLTEEYKAMKANRTAQPQATKPVGAPVKAAAATPTLKQGLGNDPHKGLDKGNLNPKTDEGGSDADEHKVPAKTKAKYDPKIIDAMSSSQLGDALLSMLTDVAEAEEEEASPPPAEKSPAPKSPAPEASPPAEEAPAPEAAPPAEEPAPEAAPPAEEVAPAPEGGELPAAPAPEGGEAMPPAGDEQAAPPADALPPAPEGGEGAPPADQVNPEAVPPTPPPEGEEAVEVPSAPKEVTTPTTITEIQRGVQSMINPNAAKAQEMKAFALKLLSDPEFLEANKEKVNAMVNESNKIIEASKKGGKSDPGFYQKKEIQDAHDKATKKNDETGFYTDHLDEVRQKTLKEIEKVSSMIDEKILAALGEEAPVEPAMDAPVEPAMEAPMGAEEDTGNDIDDLSAAMAEIENSLNATAAKSKSKSAKKSEEKSEKSEKKSEEKDCSTASLKEEIKNLEAAIVKAEGELPSPEVAPIPVPEVPAEEKSEGVASEMLVSTAELEAEGITASTVTMNKFGEGGLNPFWNITARGEPVARVYLQDQGDPEADRAFFTSAKYAEGVAQAIEKVGLSQTLASINAKLFANRIDQSVVVQKVQAEADKVIKATVAQKTASLRDELVDRMMVAQSALDKNMFKDEGNGLKEAMFIQMKKFGVNNPTPFVEAAFEQGSMDYFKTILAKAIEFLDMEPKAFEQIKRTVANSDVLAPVMEGVEKDNEIPEAVPTTLAAHLAANTMPVSLMQNTVNASYSDIKENVKLSLNLKRTV